MAVQGYVNLEPKESRIVVPVLDAAGTTVPLEMVIDTGFTGYMTLPSWVTRPLGLERGEEQRMILADGQVVSMPVCRATVIWHGRPTRIDVLELDARPVIGMSLLWGSDLAMTVRENGRVSITQPPET